MSTWQTASASILTIRIALSMEREWLGPRD
jgi:hypothetical protein